MDMYSVIINVSTLCFACGNARGSHGRYLFLETHTIGVGLPGDVPFNSLPPIPTTALFVPNPLL